MSNLRLDERLSPRISGYRRSIGRPTRLRDTSLGLLSAFAGPAAFPKGELRELWGWQNGRHLHFAAHPKRFGSACISPAPRSSVRHFTWGSQRATGGAPEPG